MPAEAGEDVPPVDLVVRMVVTDRLGAGLKDPGWRNNAPSRYRPRRRHRNKSRPSPTPRSTRTRRWPASSSRARRPTTPRRERFSNPPRRALRRRRSGRRRAAEDRDPTAEERRRRPGPVGSDTEPGEAENRVGVTHDSDLLAPTTGASSTVPPSPPHCVGSGKRFSARDHRRPCRHGREPRVPGEPRARPPLCTSGSPMAPTSYRRCRQSLTVLTTRAVARSALQVLGSHQDPEKLLSKYRGTIVSNGVVRLTATGQGAATAQHRADAVAKAFLAYRAQLAQGQLDATVAALKAQQDQLTTPDRLR